MEKNHDESLLALGDLPESCLKVLELTTPKDVCRLSVVCRSLKSAGYSNYVWEKMLPTRYIDILARASDPLQFDSKRELYFRLCKPVSIDKGTKKFWLDKATGKLCFILSARELELLWEVTLIMIAGIGILKMTRAYTVSFRLKLNGSASNHRWNDGRMIHAFHTDRRAAYGWTQPVKFRFRPPWGPEQLSARFLQNTEKRIDIEGYQMASFRHVGRGWMEFDVGEFVVQENEDGPTGVNFHMSEWANPYTKGRLLLEGVTIQPSFLATESHNVQ